MSDKDLPASPVDPLTAWRDWFAKSEREWSESLSKMMKEDGPARALGQEINALVHAQQMMKQGMAGSLASMNLPTQDQLVAMGERIGALEDAVARVEAVVVQLRHSLGGAGASVSRRGRKPPPVGGSEAKAGAAKKAASPPRKRRS